MQTHAYGGCAPDSAVQCKGERLIGMYGQQSAGHSSRMPSMALRRQAALLTVLLVPAVRSLLACKR